MNVQNPAPFVILSKKLHIAVSYDSKDLDTSCASVADRLRKQAKTRAVKVVREAIADPECGGSRRALRGLDGPHAPSLSLDKYILSRSNFIGADRTRSYLVFPAKNKCGATDGAGKGIGAAQPAIEERGGACERLLTAFFPVSLFITAIGQGKLARDISSKLRDRLEQVLSKIPKEQDTCVEVEGDVIDLKMRVFVSNSEDAKAVNDYIRTHENQVPAPFVMLARDLPMALLYNPKQLDLADSSVADRLRKQAKTRAVKLLREVIAKHTPALTLKSLRGYNGAFDPGIALDQDLKSKAAPLQGHTLSNNTPHTSPHTSSHKYVSFSARNKAIASPVIAPAPPQAHAPASHSLRASGDIAAWQAETPCCPHAHDVEAHASKYVQAHTLALPARKRRRAVGKELNNVVGCGDRSGRGGKDRMDAATYGYMWEQQDEPRHVSPPPLLGQHSQCAHGYEDEDQCGGSSMCVDAMLLIASSARAFADAHDADEDDGYPSDAHSPNFSPPTPCAPTLSTNTRNMWATSTGTDTGARSPSRCQSRQGAGAACIKTSFESWPMLSSQAPQPASASLMSSQRLMSRRSRKVPVKPRLSMAQLSMAQRGLAALQQCLHKTRPDSPKQPGIAYSPLHTPRGTASASGSGSGVHTHTQVSMRNTPCHSPRDSRGRHLWS